MSSSPDQLSRYLTATAEPHAIKYLMRRTMRWIDDPDEEAVHRINEATKRQFLDEIQDGASIGGYVPTVAQAIIRPIADEILNDARNKRGWAQSRIHWLSACGNTINRYHNVRVSRRPFQTSKESPLTVIIQEYSDLQEENAAHYYSMLPLRRRLIIINQAIIPHQGKLIPFS